MTLQRVQDVCRRARREGRAATIHLRFWRHGAAHIFQHVLQGTLNSRRLRLDLSRENHISRGIGPVHTRAIDGRCT